MLSTYSLDDFPRHQSGSLSVSQAFLNWSEFVSIGCIIQPYMIHIVKTESTLVRPPHAQYVANVSGNLGFRAAPICAVQETALRSCKKGGHEQLCQPGPQSSLSSVVCLSVNTSVPLSMSSCFCKVDSLLLENVIVLSAFHLLQIW